MNINHRLLGSLIIFFSIVFLIFYMRGLDFSVLSELELSPLYLLLSLVLALAFRYWGVFIWRTILNDLGSIKLPGFSLLSMVYAKAWFARYIPGTVAWLAGKVLLASNIGVSKSRLTVASLMEAGVQIVALAVASISVLLWDGRILKLDNHVILIAVPAMVIAMCIFLAPPVFNKIVRAVYKKIRGHAAYPELASNYRATIRSFFNYIIGFLISGSAYYFLCLSLYPETKISDMLFIIGAANLTGVIGMATPFVPSGIGVRDVSLIALLSIILPKEIALIVVIVSRLWSVLADVIFLGSAFTFSSIHKPAFHEIKTRA